MNAIRYGTACKARALVGSLLAALCCPPAPGDVCEMAKLIDVTGAEYEDFGKAVAVSGTRIVVGEPYSSDDCSGCGAALVFRWDGSGWVLESQLHGAGATVFRNMGEAVAIDGNIIVAGAPDDDDNGEQSGSAFVFHWNGFGWSQEGKLLASDGASGDIFGSAVDVSGNTAVIGAEWHDGAGWHNGAAYVYQWTGTHWYEMAKLESSDIMEDDRFGVSVAIDGDVLVVGAFQEDHGGHVGAGAAYVFRRYGADWFQEAKLTASDGAEDQYFGSSVDIDGDLIVVGASGDDDAGNLAGSVYAYRWNGANWVEEVELVGTDAGPGDRLGLSIAVSGDVIVSGAHYQDNENGPYAGAAYVFRGPVWSQVAKLLAPNGSEQDRFGWSVGADGDVAIVGLPNDDDIGDSSGSAYVYGGISDSACVGWTETDACALQDGLWSDHNANLVADICPSEAFAYNQTIGTVHASIADAIDYASSGDDLVATESLFEDEPDIDFDGKAIALRSIRDIEQASGGLITLADGARLEAPGDGSMLLMGEVRVEPGDAADLSSPTFYTDSTTLIMCRQASRLDVSSGDVQLWGIARVEEQATLAFSAPVGQYGTVMVSPGGALTANDTVTNGGPMILDTADLNIVGDLDMWFGGSITAVASDLVVTGTCDVSDELNLLGGLMIAGPVNVTGSMLISDATVLADGLNVPTGARLDVSGEIHSDVMNGAFTYCLGDTMAVGTYTNNGTTIVQVGVLTIVGTLINNGTIVGDVVGGFREGTQPGDGLAIAGDYVAGADAALLLGDPLWVLEVGGDYDVAIDDHARYDMAEAELRLAGAWQSLELMSVDIGSDRAGLDPAFAGHYPEGTLVIESGSTVELVDHHDNDGLGQALCEALYVRHLDLAPGATLNTLGCAVYYETAQIDGAIDDPANVIMLPPPCPWDCDGSGDEQVSVTDFLSILAQWGQVGAPCDFDDDGVGVTDFLALLGHWGPCPP